MVAKLKEELQRATLLIAEAKARILLQRQLIAKLAIAGKPTADAEQTLAVMLSLLDRMHEQRKYILRQVLPLSIH
jgi:hypothetical protein